MATRIQLLGIAFLLVGIAMLLCLACGYLSILAHGSIITHDGSNYDGVVVFFLFTGFVITLLGTFWHKRTPQD